MRWRCGGLRSEGWGGLLCGGDVRRGRGYCYVGMIGSVGTGWVVDSCAWSFTRSLAMN